MEEDISGLIFYSDIREFFSYPNLSPPPPWPKYVNALHQCSRGSAALCHFIVALPPLYTCTRGNLIDN